MAIVYAVRDRARRPFAQWGPTLPAPPTESPIFLAGGGSGLAETFMGEPAAGQWQGQGQLKLQIRTNFYRGRNAPPLAASGVWTGGISDCMVVCAAYYHMGSWPHFWFEHVEGGQYGNILDTITRGMKSGDCPEERGRWAFIAAGYESGTGDIVSVLMRAGILSNNIRVYVSGTGARGFAFGVNFSVGLFGETTHQGGQLPNDWKW